MADITINIEGRKLERLRQAVNTLNARVKDSDIFRDTFEEWAVHDLDPEIQDNLAGRALNRRTGSLANRTKAILVKESDKYWTVEVQSGVPYGLIHEEGGIIKAKNSKYLAIPLPAAMTAAGVIRKPPREWPNTFVRTSAAGNLIIFQNVGEGAIIPLFLLRQQVTIPATRWASGAVDDTVDKLLTRIEGVIDRAIDESLPDKGDK